MQSNEYELTRAVLHYIVASAREGNWAALRDHSMGEHEIAALQNLTIGEFALLSEQLTGHVLNVSINRDAFWMVLSEVEQEHATECVKSELVRRDAPADMMARLFNMRGREYTTLRRMLRRPRRVGRPTDPDTQTMDAIWYAWQRRSKGHEHLAPDEWIAVADDTGVDLRTIWRFVQQTLAMERLS